MKVYLQSWEESEWGWGVRPDGYSLHLTREDALTYVKDSMKEQQEYFKRSEISGVPNEYSRPCGEPREIELVGPKLTKLKKKKIIRSYTWDLKESNSFT